MWVAAHAEQLGLALDRSYLDYFEPHFDSTLHDSMTAMYRVVGPLRPVGRNIADGEKVHRSVLLRRAGTRVRLCYRILPTTNPMPPMHRQ